MPRRVADRFLRHLPRLRRLVPPRVVAAVFSTAWNRWCTLRRYQGRSDPLNVCRFGCGGNAEDSLEHYGRCASVRRFHRCFLRIDADWLLPEWIGVQEVPCSDDSCALAAIGAYAVYSVFNLARASCSLSPDEAERALQQAAREAALGHAQAERTLRQVWQR